MSLNIESLRKQIEAWRTKTAEDAQHVEQYKQERATRLAYYQSQTADKIRNMGVDDFYTYISKLWAMLIWGNKKYVVDKLMLNNGFEKIKTDLAELVWGTAPIEQRWDHFRAAIKGMGPAMMSEILCFSRPEEYMLWNRRAHVGLDRLGVDDLPPYDYQVTGKRYRALCDTAKEITQEIRNQGFPDANLLTLDFFIWSALQSEETLSRIHKKLQQQMRMKRNSLQDPKRLLRFCITRFEISWSKSECG